MAMLDYDSIKDQIVVRVTASRFYYGKWEYAFDDPVLLSSLDSHIKDLIAMGLKRISLHVLGPFSEVHDIEFEPMRGTSQYNRIKKTHRLEDF